jgi:hypothetical protein
LSKQSSRRFAATTDRLVYDLYALTEKKIAIVEGTEVAVQKAVT